MWPESGEQSKPLRTGLTTGSCATACSLAAARSLLLNEQTPYVSITLPSGKRGKKSVGVEPSATVDVEPSAVIETVPSAVSGIEPSAVLGIDASAIVKENLKIVEMTIEQYTATTEGVKTSCIKDAGDDPDATHGARLWVEVVLNECAGVEFIAGEGVGTVTREGLVLAVGEPAINPVPRQMMQTHLAALAAEANYAGGFRVTVGVERGEEIALKTMNGRLGILGGLSILGTTGIVRPFSCAAWIASIHQGIDVAQANGVIHIAASTGNASEKAIADHYDLADMALIEMGDFAGAALKHLRKAPIAKLSICGGFGKITKLANRHMDLNSRVSSIDFEQIARVAAELGASAELQAEILQANTSVQALKMCQQQGVDLAAGMCRHAREFALDKLPYGIEVEVWAVDRQGQFVGVAK
jgi:cobalt-precorrin-5B (C1)-methyltransferase